MIVAKNVSKSFEGVKALKDVNLNVEKGSVYGLVGSNGAGKTTLLKLLSGIYKQDNGEIYIDDSEVYENIDIKADIIFMPDTLYFFAQYTIKEMAKFYKRIYSLLLKSYKIVINV